MYVLFKDCTECGVRVRVEVKGGNEGNEKKTRHAEARKEKKRQTMRQRARAMRQDKE